MKRENTSSRKIRRRSSSRRRRATNRTDPQLLVALESIARSLAHLCGSVDLSLIKIEAELHSMNGKFWSFDSTLDSCSSSLSQIAQSARYLEKRPNLYDRFRLWLSNRRFRAMLNGRAQKEWSEKTREALAEFEKKAESKSTSKWDSVWQ